MELGPDAIVYIVETLPGIGHSAICDNHGNAPLKLTYRQAHPIIRRLNHAAELADKVTGKPQGARYHAVPV